jgi:type IV pilus assembly protein PilY1
LVGGKIIDANGADAVDTDKGFFKEDAKSFWSEEADGADVMRGGARNEVSATETGKIRKLLYTTAPGASLTQLDWTKTTHSFGLPNSLFGIDQTDAAGDLRRSNVFDKLKTMWGDPLHSVPLMVNYGGTADNNYVFVSNNGGMLHAIKTDDGSEAFAFMPHEFLKQVERYTTQRPALNEDNTRQTYGLDGNWVAWRKAGASIDAAPEHVYLYGGMRRGGRNYYALDVTSPTAPQMKWQISNSTSGFSELGQTWSTPTVTKVPGADGPVPAIVFGGGYSPADHDGAYGTRSASDAMGRAVYIVNADTGALIWKASHDDMKWAIPSSIAVVDFNLDGVADFLYFGDLGGQVFRVKLDQTGGNEHVTTKIASLGGSGASHRRFFEAPAISLGRDGGKNALYVAIGSGYRAHPLDDDTKEGFFVIRDVAALNADETTEATIDKLEDVDSDDAAPSDAVGWYYLFERAGEKVMATPAIYDKRILFSTYAPTEQEDEDPCSVRYGDAYLHTVYLQSGSPAPLKDVVDAVTGEVTNLPAERSKKLLQSTPPPTPALIIDEDGNTVVVVGTEVVGQAGGLSPDLRKRRWMQLPKTEANTIIDKVTETKP